MYRLLIFSLYINISISPIIIETQNNFLNYEFIENIDIETHDDEITMIIELDVKLTDNPSSLEKNTNVSEKDYYELRKENFNLYSTLNNEFVNRLLISEVENIIVSDYSPFIFIEFDSYFEYNLMINKLKRIINGQNVSKVYVENTPIYSEQANVNLYPSSTTVDMASAKEIISIDSNEYTGKNIKIGILESTSPANLTNFSNTTIVNNNSVTGEHSTLVASIIGGTYGIAPDAELYFASSLTLVSSINWLIDSGVDIINMSFSTDDNETERDHYGKYMGHSAYIDYTVWRNNIFLVKSSGNTSNDGDQYAGLITNPGLGLNVCTVGSVDESGNISNFSSFDVVDELATISIKPNLVAPGENIYIPNTYNDNLPKDGTSFSAPMVTGVAALLMEEFPDCIGRPYLLMSALINGATPLPSQTDLLDNEAGAGMLNYEATRECLNNNSYILSYLLVDECVDNQIITETEISIGPNSYLDYSLAVIANHNNNYNFDSSYIPTITNYIVEIYNNGLLIQTLEYGSNSNTILGRVSNLSSYVQTYDLFVKLNGTKENDFIEYQAITFYHPHSFDYSITQYNETHHKRSCFCGEYSLKTHNFTLYNYINNAYHNAICSVCNSHVPKAHTVMGGGSKCIQCGGIVGVGITPFHKSGFEIELVSNNGNYILPNGIIVLEP